MKKVGRIFVFSIILFSQCISYAQDSAEQKAATCVACHGPKGVSLNPAWPNLAGQHPSYLRKQLQDFKIGKTRPNAIMQGIVAPLSEADMTELALYYAKLPLGAGKTPDQYIKKGELLYRGGDRTKGIPACIACHGPKGTGNNQAGFPVLSGQQAAYTIAQLNEFKESKRSNDLNAIMRDISSRMSKEDMEVVAYYIQGLY